MFEYIDAASAAKSHAAAGSFPMDFSVCMRLWLSQRQHGQRCVTFCSWQSSHLDSVSGVLLLASFHWCSCAQHQRAMHACNHMESQNCILHLGAVQRECNLAWLTSQINLSLQWVSHQNCFQPSSLSKPLSQACSVHVMGSSSPTMLSGSAVTSPFSHSNKTLCSDPLQLGSNHFSGP